MMLNQVLQSGQYWGLFIGVNLTFMPGHFIGLNGMPRRYTDYSDLNLSLQSLRSIGMMASLVSFMLAGNA